MTTNKCSLDEGGVLFLEHALAKLERDLERSSGSARDAALVVRGWLADALRALRAREETTVHQRRDGAGIALDQCSVPTARSALSLMKT